VLTDVIARFRRLMGDSVYFLTGTDEHGQKVQQSPRGPEASPRRSLPTRSAASSGRCCRACTSRTTTSSGPPRSGTSGWCASSCSAFSTRATSTWGEYRGFYSTGQEQFLQEKDRNPDGSWPEIFGEVTEIVEPNYFFRLRSYQGWLVEFLGKNEDFVFPGSGRSR
jgi:methionyl-tRNA synthetase